MGIFDRLTGGTAAAKAPVKVPAKPAVVRPAAASAAPLPSNVKLMPLRASAPSAAPVAASEASSAVQGGAPIYKSTSDLPDYSEVASLAGRRFALPVKTQEMMCVLQVQDAANQYVVVTTRENFGSALCKGTIQRITADGARVVACGIADGALINKLNGDAAESAESIDKADTLILRDIDKLVQDALDADASDIHIEKRLAGAVVKLRVNGRLEVHSDSWDAAYVDRLGRALHASADDDSKDVTQNESSQMSVSRKLGGKTEVKLRVQMSPAYPDGGLDIVIRVLRVAASVDIKSLQTLGYAPEHIEMVEYMLSSPAGLVMIAGTTGSGKSTTLQTFMHDIRVAGDGLKMISIEDPPEYILPGVTQIPVRRPKKNEDDRVKNPFAQAMKATMRMDPDVIMIGEIRDSESAVLTVAMVQSGHKALGTIHTESALGVVGRLRSMGVDSEVLSSRRFISGLIFQTLVPVLCPRCKEDYDPASEDISPALHARLRHVCRTGDTIFTERKGGCQHCSGRGIVGRTVCAEMVVPDATILECIRVNDMTRAHNHWRKQRVGQSPDSMAGATALDHGLLKMRRGEVSPHAIESALGLLHDFTQEVSLTGAETSDLLQLEAV